MSGARAVFFALVSDFTEGLRAIMGFIPPPPPPAAKRDKPEDCTCAFPAGYARNMTEHAQSCPVYKRIMGRVLDDAGEFIAPHNVPPVSPLPQSADEAQPDQFGPLALGTDGQPFVYPEEGEPQPANETIDNSRRAQHPRTGLIPGRPGQSLKG